MSNPDRYRPNQRANVFPMNPNYRFDYVNEPPALMNGRYMERTEQPIESSYGYGMPTSFRPFTPIYTPTLTDVQLYPNGQNPRFVNRGRNGRQFGNRGRGSRNGSYSRGSGYRPTENKQISRDQQEVMPQRWDEDVDSLSRQTYDPINVLPSGGDIDDGNDEEINELSEQSSDAKTDGTDVESQRDVLAKQLFSGRYECMICCNHIRRQVAIWSCDSCFHLFHLFCIKKWSQSMKIGVAPISPLAEELARSGHKVWRCPACQKEHTAPSFRYVCFCGKTKEPEYSPHLTPHTCGEVCGKSGGEGCIHQCLLLCHPGPCPPCDVFISRSCECGTISATSKCSSRNVLRCESKCQKKRNCGMHMCGVVCHEPPCPPCAESIDVSCFCGATSRSFVCGSPDAVGGPFSCQSRCGRTLACGQHPCRLICHSGPCPPCRRLPTVVVTCPCGRVPIAELLTGKDGERVGDRQRCTDPIPVCSSGATCDRALLCGHTCPEQCHDSDCPPCTQTRTVKCRCGKASKEVSCADWDPTVAGEFLCQRRCRKKKTCGRCRCGDVCCIDIDHVCSAVCGKLLSCGQHTCEKSCHLGRCMPCERVSYSELRCTCGLSSLPPPVPCGTKPPECREMCTRDHPCEHPVRHSCHSDPECPPCTYLVSKRCLGDHTTRHNIPCFQRSVTCGQPCGLRIKLCGHLCNRPCHEGPCVVDAESGGQGCRQPCTVQRQDCGHPCAAPCHVGQPCPGGQCTQQVEVQCGCGLRKKTLTCHGLTTLNKWELWGALQGSQSSSASIGVDQLSRKTRQTLKLIDKEIKNRRLECDSLCSQVERNRAFAEALNISDADPMPSTGTTPYSRFLRDFARSNFDFANSVEKSLDELMRTAKESKHKSRSHSFSPMNRDKRRFVHELAEFYLCETQSYDAEPNRSVVVTAKKERCRQPAVRLSFIVQEDIREDAKLSGRVLSSAQVLRPVGGIKQMTTSSANSNTVFATASSSTATGSSGLQVLGRVPSSSNSKPEIDYFDD